MPGQVLKVLYLEDDQILAELTQAVLEDDPTMTIEHCSSGAEALERIDSIRPDCLLLDVMVPDIDGPEVLRRIREKEGYTNIPAIFMTAKAQTHEQKAYIDAGACGVIVKPYEPDELGDELRRLWGASS